MSVCKIGNRLGLLITAMSFSFIAAVLCWIICGLWYWNVYGKLSRNDRMQTITILNTFVLIAISLERTLRVLSNYFLFYGDSLFALLFFNVQRLLIPAWVLAAMHCLSVRLSTAFAESLYKVTDAVMIKQRICLMICITSLTCSVVFVVFLDFTGDEIYRIGTIICALITVAAVSIHLVMVNYGFVSRLKSLVAAQSVHMNHHSIINMPPIISPNRASVTGTNTTTGRPSVSEMSTTHTATSIVGIRQALTFSSMMHHSNDNYTSTSTTDGVGRSSLPPNSSDNTNTPPNQVGRHRSRGSSVWSEFKQTNLDEFDDSQRLLLSKAAKSTVISAWFTLTSFIVFVAFILSRFHECVSPMALVANGLLGFAGLIASICTLLSTSQASDEYDQWCSICHEMVLKICTCLTNRQIDENVFAGVSPISPKFSINFRVESPDPLHQQRSTK